MTSTPLARVLLDANLLTLLVVGSVNPARISQHRRTSAYDRRDYELLLRFIGVGIDLVLTPNVATEASNLLRYKDADGRLGEALRLVCLAASETYAPTAAAVSRPEHLRLGVTDAALLVACEPGTLLLTADGALYDAAARAGCAVERFEHLRKA